MQNQIIKHQLLDNSIDSWILINPTKQQIFALPKEESQMFTSRNITYNGNNPVGYTNDPSTETENRDSLIPSGTQNSSFTATDYMGMSVMSIPAILDHNFTEIKLFNNETSNLDDLYIVSDSDLKSITNGLQMIRIPSEQFNETLTDEDEITANGGVIKKNYDKYFLMIQPKSIKTAVINIIDKKHFAVDKLIDNIALNSPEFKRRTIIECDNDNFKNLSWNFEQYNKQTGRLFGSVVEVWNSSETVLKQTKVMAENDFNFVGSTAVFVLYPDNMGYDSPEQEISVNDIIKIYPRETYFNQISIEISYEDESLQISSALSYLLNDVVRDMKTGMYEIYDNNGVKVDEQGNFNGKIIHRYQVKQLNSYELRKKLKKNV